MSEKQINLEKEIMTKIESGQIKMKPRWFFVVGSLATILGLVGLSVLSIFLVSLMSFSLRTHGVMGEIRYQEILSNFPWWAVLVAIGGLGAGLFILKRYDFSYKKNYLAFSLGVILAILVAGWLVDYVGLDKVWSNQEPMRKLYQQYDGRRRLENGSGSGKQQQGKVRGINSNRINNQQTK